MLEENGIDRALSPTLTYSSARTPNLEALIGFVSNALTSGAMVPDEALDAHMRSVAGLPVMEDAEVT